MGEDRPRMARATTLPVILCVAGLLVLLSLLRPAEAYPLPYETTITPTCFVYLPFVAKEATPTPTPIPGVDLIVWDIVISPDTPVAGHTFAITVTAKNQGGDDATVGTYIRLNVGGWQFDTFVAPLAAGAAGDAVWALSLSSAGPYTARGEVDPDNLVPETDEGNNVLQQPFIVVPYAK